MRYLASRSDLACATVSLYFAAMSSSALDAAAYYYQYKLTVYDNLFVGIVYGESKKTCRFSSSF
jgi:hypothetical protein